MTHYQRRPIEIRACNLMSGMRVCEVDEVTPDTRGQITTGGWSGAWQPALVTREPFDGDVYSIEVDVEHTYVADGIVTHNCWHLDGPKINADYILFDEAQDANPVLVDIIRQQEHAQLVWVGDSQQSIYGFTGAENALKTVGAEQTAMLTQSFRFGPEIADVANRCLEGLNAPLRLTGTDTIPSRVVNDTIQIGGSRVILSRTNAAAVRELLATIRAGRSGHLVGGGRDVLDFAKAARQLKEDSFTSHPELACFQSWAEVQTYVEQDEQGDDLSLLVKLIDDFGVERIIEALERMPAEEDADVILSTAHKAKGREWDSVKLAADFPAEPRDEELRLLYVAVTRARMRLDISAIAYLTEGAQPAIDVLDIELRSSEPMPAPAPRSDGWPSDRSNEMRSRDGAPDEIVVGGMTFQYNGSYEMYVSPRETVEGMIEGVTPEIWEAFVDAAGARLQDPGREPEADHMGEGEDHPSSGLGAIRPTAESHRPAPDETPSAA